MNVLERVKDRIAKTRSVECAGVLLCLVGLVAVTLAVCAHYSLWAWGLVAIPFLVGMICWLFPSQTIGLWSSTGIVRRKQKAFESFFTGLARTDGPTAEELRVEAGTGGTSTTQMDLIEPHLEKVTGSIQHFENIEEHRLTRKHLLCLAGSLLTVFSFLAVHVPSRMAPQHHVTGETLGAGVNNQTVHTNGPPEKVAKRVKEVIPSAVETPSPNGPQITVPIGTPAPPDKLDVDRRGKQLAGEFDDFMKDAKQYGIALADPANDVKATKEELIKRGEELQVKYEQLAKDATAAGMSDTAADAKKLAESAKKTTDEIKETKPEETDPEKRKEDSKSFLDDLKEILEDIKEFLELVKEVWDALKKIFPELGDESDGENGDSSDGEGKDGKKKEGKGEGEGKDSKEKPSGSPKPGDGSEPSEPSKGASGSGGGTTVPSPTKTDTTITFSPKGTPSGTTGLGGGRSGKPNTSGAGKVEGESPETVPAEPAEPG